jgi:hypothetical protein
VLKLAPSGSMISSRRRASDDRSFPTFLSPAGLLAVPIIAIAHRFHEPCGHSMLRRGRSSIRFRAGRKLTSRGLVLKKATPVMLALPHDPAINACLTIRICRRRSCFARLLRAGTARPR